MEQPGFWKLAATAPDPVAVIEPDGHTVSRGELLAHAHQLVHGLRALGLERGDAVAILLPNGAAVFEVFFAAAQAGWFVVPINWHLTAPEIAYILKDSGTKAFFTAARFAATAGPAADEAGLPASARFVVGEPVVTGAGEPASGGVAGLTGFRPYEELMAGQPATLPTDRAAGGPMNYTSGTTGRPKGVRRRGAVADPDVVASQQALFLALFGMFPGSAGVHIVGAPLYHTAVLNFATNHLHLGHSVVLMDKWTPEAMLELIQRYRVTNSHMVPTQFNRLLKLPDEVKRKYDVSSLSHVIHSAAPCPVPTKQAMLDWWGDCIYEYYAASEGGGTLATPADWRKKPGTVGKPWPISQIRVLDDAHQPVPPGTVGTVWIKMGDFTFEYHGDEKKTGDAWREGFFTVGDAGYLDADGYLFLSDRKADMIISGGVNIYPAEIESVFHAHPEVADVAVFGIPDEDWGESVKAVVQPVAGVSGGPELEARLLGWAGERLAKYKLPRSLDFMAELPRDPNGKLYKRKLRDPYWEGRGKQI